MSTIALFCVVFACIFASAMLALLAGRLLPEHHLRSDSRDAVKLGMGLIATLAALVLGLLIAAAKGTYDTQNSGVKQMAAQVTLLDLMLARYGPQTREARQLLHRALAALVEDIWPAGGTRSGSLAPGEARGLFEAFYDQVAALTPKTDAQRAIRARVLDLTTELAQTRLRLFANKDSSIPWPFLVVLVFWLVVLFAGFGVLALPNGTVVVALLVCALSVSGALFMILELDRPFEGIMQVSSAPLQEALSRIGA